VVFDAETLRFLAVNEAALYGYGYSREEFLSMTIEDLRSPDEVAEAAWVPRQPRRRMTVRTLRRAGVWHHRRKDGTGLDVEVTSHDHQFEGRRATVTLALDVTSGCARRRHWGRARRVYRDLFENATDLIATTMSTGVSPPSTRRSSRRSILGC